MSSGSSAGRSTEQVGALSGLGRLSGTDALDFDTAYIECDDDRGYHEIGYTEYLQFALGNGDIDTRYLQDGTGWLTAEGVNAAYAAITKILTDRSRLSADIIATLDVNDALGGDDPNITVTITVPADADITIAEAYDSIFWPFWASMANMTDPGTFNYPYLWAQL